MLINDWAKESRADIFPDRRVKACLLRFRDIVRAGHPHSIADLFARDAVLRDDRAFGDQGKIVGYGRIGGRLGDFVRGKEALTISFARVSHEGEGVYDVDATFQWFYASGPVVRRHAPFKLELTEFGEIKQQHFYAPEGVQKPSPI